jgi:hypothetical protein
MSYVGKGFYIDLSINPSPATLGQSCDYSVEVKTGKTKLSWKVKLSNRIMGPALKFDGCNPPDSWGPEVQVSYKSPVVPTQKVNVMSGTPVDEYIHCLSVEFRPPVPPNSQWQICNQNLPVVLQVQIA